MSEEEKRRLRGSQTRASERKALDEALDEAIERFRFEGEEDYGGHIFLSYSSRHPQKLARLFPLKEIKPSADRINYKISNI